MAWHPGWMARTDIKAYNLAVTLGACHCHSEEQELPELTVIQNKTQPLHRNPAATSCCHWCPHPKAASSWVPAGQATCSLDRELVPTFSFCIFPAKEEWVPTCWKSEGLKRILRFAFCLSQCFWNETAPQCPRPQPLPVAPTSQLWPTERWARAQGVTDKSSISVPFCGI